jgi:hypothetical protein
VDPRIGLEEIDDIGDELVDLPLIRARGEPGRVVHTGKLGDPDGFLAVSVPVVVLRASERIQVRAWFGKIDLEVGRTISALTPAMLFLLIWMLVISQSLLIALWKGCNQPVSAA